MCKSLDWRGFGCYHDKRKCNKWGVAMAGIGYEEDFGRLVELHADRYPLMQPVDWGKLLYQSCFGPEHLLGTGDEERVYERLAAEWQGMEPELVRPGWDWEPLAGGICRLHLPGAGEFSAVVCRLLARLFCCSGAGFRPAEEAVVAKRQAKLAEIPGVERWLREWEEAGRPAPSHSQEFRRAYRPHYRLLRRDWAVQFGAMARVAKLLAERGGKPCVVVIDGHCGSGKTSLAAALAVHLAVQVVHIDDYYLPLERRKPDWQRVCGGNLDRERFVQEVVQPLREGREIRSRAYDCQRGVLEPERVLPVGELLVIEGSYSMLLTPHELWDLSIFTECGRGEQERRLREREGEYFAAFERLWLPLEAQYFAQYDVKKRCDMRVFMG